MIEFLLLVIILIMLVGREGCWNGMVLVLVIVVAVVVWLW